MKPLSATMYKIVIALVCVAAFSFVALYMSRYYNVVTGKTATIVVSAPLVLESSTIITQSITLALEEINYTVAGITLKLAIREDGDESGAWIAEKEEKIAHDAIDDPSTIAYIGPINSGAAKISMPILNKAGILQISPSNTWPGLTKIGFLPGEPGIFNPTGIRNYVRVCTTDDLQGPAGAQWAKDLGFTTIYIVDDGEAYGAGISRLFEDEAVNLALNIVGKKTLAQNTQYDTLATDIASSKADLVYYGGITPNGGPELLKALRNIAPHIAFMGPDGIYEQDFIDRAGTSSEGVYVTTVGAPPAEVKNPAAQEYVKKYQERFNSTPDVFGALAYEAMKVVIASIARVDSVDRASLLKEVRSTRDYNGVFGRWSFDQNGDTSLKLMSGNQVVGGVFVFKKIFNK